MNILLFFLVSIYLLSCFALIAVILLQSGKGGGLSSLAGGGGGGIGDAIGATSAEKFMNRVTTSIAVGFFLLAIAISIISSRTVDDTPESVFANVSDAVEAPVDGAASLGGPQAQPISVGAEPMAGPPVSVPPISAPPVAADPGLPRASQQSAPETEGELEPVSSGPARLIEPMAEPETAAPAEATEPAAAGSVSLPEGFGEPAGEPEMPAEEPAAAPAEQPAQPAQPQPAPPAEAPAPEGGDSLLKAVLGVNPDSDL